MAVKWMENYFSTRRYSLFRGLLVGRECVKWGQTGCVEPVFGTLSSLAQIGEELGAESGRFSPVFHPFFDPLRTRRDCRENSGHTFQTLLSMELENRFPGPNLRFSHFSQTLLPVWAWLGGGGQKGSILTKYFLLDSALSPPAFIQIVQLLFQRPKAGCLGLRGGVRSPSSKIQEEPGRI